MGGTVFDTAKTGLYGPIHAPWYLGSYERHLLSAEADSVEMGACPATYVAR